MERDPGLAKQPEVVEATPGDAGLGAPPATSDPRREENFEQDFEEILPSGGRNPSLERYIKHHKVKTEASKDDIASKASNLDSDEGSLGPYGHIKPNIRLQIELKPPNQNHSRSYLTDIPELEVHEPISIHHEDLSRADKRHRTHESPRVQKSPSLQKHSARKERPFSKYQDQSSGSGGDRPVSSVKPKPGPLPKSEYRKMLEMSENNKNVYRHIFKDGGAFADLSHVLKGQDRHLVSQSPTHKKPSVKGTIGEKYTKLPVILLNEKKGTRLLRAAPKSFISNYHEAQVKNRSLAPAFSPAPRHQFSKPDWWG